MKSFEYGDREIGMKEMAMTISSMIIGVGILTLPRVVASKTESSDGWISIVIAGGFALFSAWVISKLVSKYYNKTYFEYSSFLISKPVAYALTFLQLLYFMMFCSYEVRAIGIISKQYLFDRTPVEVIALTFLLTAIFAVSGSRVGLVRLNVLFLPLVLLIAGVVLFFGIGLFKMENIKPFFVTDWKHILSGAKEGMFSLLGFEILLFYISMMNRPKEATKAALIGVSIPIALYILFFLLSIGSFSYNGTLQILFPTVEIAKEIEFPGEFFERFESIFFVIWIMTIFNTTSMALDVSVVCLSSMFKNVSKNTWIIIISPIVYLASMSPQNFAEFSTFGTWISYMGILNSMFFPSILLLLSKYREVKSNG